MIALAEVSKNASFPSFGLIMIKPNLKHIMSLCPVPGGYPILTRLNSGGLTSFW